MLSDIEIARLRPYCLSKRLPHRSELKRTNSIFTVNTRQSFRMSLPKDLKMSRTESLFL